LKIANPQIDNQANVSHQEQKSSVETVDPLDDGLINPANTSQTVIFPDQGTTVVILRRQGEHAEQRKVEKNNVENFDSDKIEAKKNVSECNDGGSVPCIPCMENESVTSLCLPISSGISDIVEVKAVASSRSNGSTKGITSFDESFEMFHSKQLGGFFPNRMPLKTNVHELEPQCSKRHRGKSQRKCRHV
jgi:hypothetical protein